MSDIASPALFVENWLPSLFSFQVASFLVYFFVQGLFAGIGILLSTVCLSRAKAAIRYRVLVCWLVWLVLGVPATWYWHAIPAILPTGGESTSAVHAVNWTMAASSPDYVANGIDGTDVGNGGNAVGWPVFVTLLYLVGLLGMSVRLGFACLRLSQVRGKHTPVADPRIQAHLKVLCQKLQLKRIPLLGTGESVVTPVVFGVVRPIILLPTFAISGMTSEELDAVLLHELAHIRRGDLWINWLQRIAETLFFFHPVVWYVSHQISKTREACCDDLVVTHIERGTYARALLTLAERWTQFDPHAIQLAAVRKTSDLRHRMQRILAPEPKLTWHASLYSVLACVVLIGVGGFALLAQETTSRTEAVERDDPASSRIPADPVPAPTPRKLLRSIELSESVESQSVLKSVRNFLEDENISSNVEVRADNRSLIIYSNDATFLKVHTYLVGKKLAALKPPKNAVVYLKYTVATDVASQLKKNLPDAFRSANVATDARLNAIVMRGKSKDVEALQRALALMDQQGPAAIPRSAKRRVDPQVSARVEHGKNLFEIACKHCHGKDGDGDGPTASFLKPKPRDFTSKEFKNALTTDGGKVDLKRTLLQGIPGTAMPSFSQLSKHQLEALDTYVRYLAAGRRLPAASSSKLLFPPEVEAGTAVPVPNRIPIRQNLLFDPDVERGMMIKETPRRF